MIDDAVCASFPIGSHFMWHILNGIMLGWMILVYCRHMRAGPACTPRAIWVNPPKTLSCGGRMSEIDNETARKVAKTVAYCGA